MTRNFKTATRRLPAIAFVGALAMLIVPQVATVATAGSPLLSGYGGPGAGDQTILGATLLNAPRSSGGASSSPTARVTAPSVPSRGSVALAGTRKGTTHRQVPAHGEHPVQGGALAPAAGPALDPGAALGFTFGDLIALLALVAVLAAIGVLARRLSRTATFATGGAEDGR
jgi:hypothetical protein